MGNAAIYHHCRFPQDTSSKAEQNFPRSQLSLLARVLGSSYSRLYCTIETSYRPRRKMPGVPSPLIVATSSKPPPPSSTSASSASSSSCAAVIDPISGSVLPSLRTGAGIGLASLCRYPLHTKFSEVLAGAGVDVYYGHGHGSGSPDPAASSASSRRADENIYLIAHRHSASHSGGIVASGAAGASMTMTTMSGSIGQRWRIKPPEPITSNICVSPCGTFVLAGAKSGRCYVWNALGTAGASSSRGGGGASGGPSTASSSASASTGGELLRIWTAHNRPVTSVTFSSDGALVVTAGQDGIVNAFALLDVVSSPSSSSFSLSSIFDTDCGDVNESSSGGGVDDSVRPVRTFSEHHLPVHAIATLPSNRLVSVSSDRQLILMELCSGLTLARVLLPASIRSVAADGSGRRVYAGGDDGVVYCVDLDVLAVKETAESATVMSIGGGSAGSSKRKFTELSLSGSRLGETILGISGTSKVSSSASGCVSNNEISELRGHLRPVTALAVIDNEQLHSAGTTETLLVSGSDDGTLRVWDLRTRACTRVIRPWGGGNSGGTSSGASSASSSPISSLLVVPQDSHRVAASSDSSGPFGLGAAAFHSRGRGADAAHGALNLFRPLQRFNHGRPINHVVPILKATRDTSLIRRWEGEETNTTVAVQQHGVQKRFRSCVGKGPFWDADESKASGDAAADEDDGFTDTKSAIPVPEKSEAKTASSNDEVAALRKELEEARATIKRWEKVNNKMAAKLQKVMSGAQG